eukprot:1876709-Prymnesium_polylepis.1
MAAEIPGVEASDMSTTCQAASVKVTLDINVPDDVQVSTVTGAVNTQLSSAAAATSFFSSLGVTVTSSPA